MSARGACRGVAEWRGRPLFRGCGSGFPERRRSTAPTDGDASMTGTDLDRIFGALSDPTRRRLLETLRDGSARVTDLAEPLPTSLNAVSKHLKVLEGAGLVRRDIVGREHRISLDATPFLDAMDWIARYEAFWTERIDALEAYLLARRRAAPDRSADPNARSHDSSKETDR